MEDPLYPLLLATARSIRAHFTSAEPRRFSSYRDFICENNLLHGTSVERSTSAQTNLRPSGGYDIPSCVVDGMNFRQVRHTLSEVSHNSQGSASAFVEGAPIAIAAIPV